jgi:HCOMODA/2-hydroxy-3-carboxy-muconic semialdehyde decarboxylase
VTSVLLAVSGARSAAPLQGQPGGKPASNLAGDVDELVLANRILANEEVLDGTGHVSRREAARVDRFMLSRSIAPAAVGAADVMEFDLNGNPVDLKGRAIYSERFIHAAIYKARPGVMAIVHSHTPSLLPFANSNVPLRPIYQMSAFLHSGAPVWDIRSASSGSGMLVTDMRLGESLAKALGGGTVVLMRGHGAVAVGRSIPEMVSNAVHLDLNARMQIQAASLGAGLQYLSDAEAKGYANHPYERVWDHLKIRLERNAVR